MSSDLKGKVALVTGASRGLGEGAARALAAAGAAVMLVARDGALAGSVAREIAAKGARAEALSCDVAGYAAIQKVVAETTARLGRIDILINNAGVIDPIAEVATSDPAAWAQNISINLIGAYHVLRAVLPDMLAKGGGSIVNVSSGAAYRPLEGWSA
ncbi:MAG TPA: SDR family NAD(P)-dependent oxidoreductase, partial [Reyranella sp.]|nr:SDR family NAD(P)-dependent oxidoreductase [Reyranella sp.]